MCVPLSVCVCLHLALAPETALGPGAPVTAGLGVVGDASELGELGITRLAFRAGGRAHCGDDRVQYLILICAPDRFSCAITLGLEPRMPLRARTYSTSPVSRNY